MKIKIKTLKATACMAAGFLMLAAPAQSASDGSLGATSSGTALVTVTVPQMVRITGLADLVINPYAGPSSFASDDVCVFSNTGNYDITVTSVEGAFTLTGQTVPAETIAYSVEWDDASGSVAGTTLTYNTALVTQATTGANLACANVGGANASLIVRVTDAGIGTGSAQDYAGTLNLLVAPN